MSQIPAIIEVIWLDSTTINYGAWCDRDDILDSIEKKGMIHRSAGYLVAEGNDGIVIAAAIDDQEDFDPANRVAGAIAIPTVCILETAILREQVERVGK